MGGKGKILILGATAETVPLVTTAKRMGVATYVADHRCDSPAKAFADKPLLLDCFDVDALCEYIASENIDGVMVGCADILVPIYQEVCERTGRFCYATADQVKVFCNKKHFKEALRIHGLPTVPEFHLDERFLEQDLERIKYPVLVKPVDNNSSRGISVCRGRDDLRDVYGKALAFSRSKTVLVEKYMICDDFTIGYAFRKGKISVLFTSDRYVNREQDGVGTITAGVFYPSMHSGLYFSTVHEKICELFRDMRISDGTMSIQGFVEHGEIMFYDPAFRISGGQEYILNKYFSDIDLLEGLVNFSLAGEMGKGKLFGSDSWRFSDKCAANLAFSVKTGKIGRIDGMEDARAHPKVINVTQEHHAGDVISLAGTAQQNIARMHLVADTQEDLADTVQTLQKSIKAYDVEGRDMMLTGVDTDFWLASEARHDKHR